MDLTALIRSIPDYPKPGILFRDITTLLQNGEGFRHAVDLLVERYRGRDIAKVAAIEARGFILGGAVAHGLRAGFVPIRKRGKLPHETVGHDYELGYGTDRVELHADAVESGERVLLLDDLIATGGTAEAAARLLSQIGGQVVEAGFIIELDDLLGRQRLEQRGVPVHSLLHFPGH